MRLSRASSNVAGGRPPKVRTDRVEVGDRVRTPSGFTGTVVHSDSWALVRRDELPGWPPVPYDHFELTVIR